ncbi:hypothetical protein MRX96_031994 [Rhipicephalus microplus]
MCGGWRAVTAAAGDRQACPYIGAAQRRCGRRPHCVVPTPAPGVALGVNVCVTDCDVVHQRTAAALRSRCDSLSRSPLLDPGTGDVRITEEDATAL